MRLLANENVPAVAVEALRTAGHDVLWAKTEMPSAPDPAVLACARSDRRILLTLDKDFGELAFRAGLDASPGVVLFRIAPLSPEYLARTIAAVLASRDDWAGHFATVDPGDIRLIPLPRVGR